MTRETKVGLLVGLGMILLIGVIVSDHLSVVSQQEAARMTQFADGAQRSLGGDATPRTVAPAPAPPPAPAPLAATPHDAAPVPLTQELRQPVRPPNLAPQTPRDAAADLADLPPRDTYPQRAYALADDSQPIAPRTVHDLVVRDQTGVSAGDVYTVGVDPRLVPPARDAAFVPVRHELDRGSDALRFHETPRVAPVIDAADRSTSSPAPPAAPPASVTVKNGQTLTAIAREHLGNGNRWREIFELNRDKLDTPESLQAGMQIRLPRHNAPTAALPGAAPNAATGTTGNSPTRQAAAQAPRTYTVKRGDTLYKIAQQTMGDGNAWKALYNANKSRIANPDAIEAGIELTIPRG